MLQYHAKGLPPSTWKKVHARRMGPFQDQKNVKANVCELNLPSDMGIGLVLNVGDLTPYHGPANGFLPSSPSLFPTMSTLTAPTPPHTSLIEPILVSPCHGFPPPLVSAQQAAKVIEDVLHEQIVSTGWDS